jgi:hypothetical protein
MLFASSQVIDYMCRGEDLEGYNVFDFVTDTYEEPIPRTESKEQTDDNPSEAEEEGFRRGRRPNNRVRYRANHPKQKTAWRVVRSLGHNNLANIVGKYFPRNDDLKTYPFYCACMLVLLKPWRDITQDLKSDEETWEEAFDNFVKATSPKIRRVLANIQYFHACESAAMNKQEEEALNHELVDEEEDGADPTDCEKGFRDDDTDEEWNITDEAIEAAEGNSHSWRDILHGRQAIEMAQKANIFSNSTENWMISGSPIHNATGDDLRQLAKWRNQMKKDIDIQNTTENEDQAQSHTANNEIEATIQHIGEDVLESKDKGTLEDEDDFAPETALQAVDASELNVEQYRAFDIIRRHLRLTLQGMNPPPLRMICYGEGGTGKSQVIQTTTETFDVSSVPHLLLKSAYTGIAASLVKGKTTHFIGQLSIRNNVMISDETKQRLRQIWKDVAYLVIDEFSMLSKTFLARLSRAISIAITGTDNCTFGGISVVLCGDLHQFPPVASQNDALFYPSKERDTLESRTGRAIYEEFQTVVILRQQYRVTDPVWNDFLQHLRYGLVQERHIDVLRKLVINTADCPETKFDEEPWKSAPLVTPRHSVRAQWNDAAVRKWCEEKGEQLFICHGEDTINKRSLTQVERYAVAMRGQDKNGKRKANRGLPTSIQIAKGMQIMVTTNIETDLDIANGARGEIVDIVLHPDEPPLPNTPIVKLTRLPAYLLVKLTRTRATQLEGLEERVIPVEPTSIKFQIKVKSKGKVITRTVTRLQYPVTGAYAFTDYRSQGQTIPYVIIDIGKVPTGGSLNLFNLYVALSRSRGQDTIRLLRDFDDNMFKKAHTPALNEEDE